jgi:hypothetical protein
LLKDIGMPHAIFNKDSDKLHKATDNFWSWDKKTLGGDAKLHKLLSALRWLIYNFGKLFSFQEACRQAGNFYL